LLNAPEKLSYTDTRGSRSARPAMLGMFLVETHEATAQVSTCAVRTQGSADLRKRQPGEVWAHTAMYADMPSVDAIKQRVLTATT
jgi:hypothetical protein